MDAKLTAGSVTLMVYLFLHVRSGTDNGSQEPRLDNWRHFNFSAIDTLVRMSGHPLQVAADGQVSIGPKSAWPDSELLCHAHSFGVRVVAVVLSKHKGDPAFFTKLLGNASAVTLMAGQLAAAVEAAGFDGVEFDFETISGSTANASFNVGQVSSVLHCLTLDPNNLSWMDVVIVAMTLYSLHGFLLVRTQAHVAMVKETATAVAAAVPNATTTLTMGCLNASDTNIFKTYFQD